MNRIAILWHRWCLNTALDELREFQARFDVDPRYLVNTLMHIAHLRELIRRRGGVA
jgi:hypothetical protein